jgi:hypothetical protein
MAFSKISNFLNETKEAKNSLIIPTIKISTSRFTEQDLDNLVRNGLGDFGTTHLEITDTKNGDHLVLFLREAVERGAFPELKTLILRNNKLTAMCLPDLAKIGQLLNLEIMDLSDNKLMVSTEPDVAQKHIDFFRMFNQNFAAMKELRLKNISLNFDNVEQLKPLFAQPSVLATLDITANNFGPKNLEKLIKSDEVQCNLNVDHIITEYRKSRPVVQAIAARDKKYETLNLPDEESAVFNVLNRLTSNQKKESQKMFQSLKDVFSEQTAQKWQLWAKSFQAFSYEGSDEEKLIAFNRVAPARLIDMAVDRVLKCAQNKQFDFKLEHKIMSIALEEADITSGLNRMLKTLESKDNNPIIRTIDLSDTYLSTKGLKVLVENGLGDYKTQHLSLANNHLNDEAMNILASQNHFAQLQSLDLSGNHITAEGLDALVKFCRNTGVKELNLSGNILISSTVGHGVRQRQMKAFAEFSRNLYKNAAKLQKLNIAEVGLDNDSLNLLAPILQNMSMLKSLDISHKGHYSMAFLNLLEAVGFHSNITLLQLEMGRNNRRNNRRQLENKQEIINAFKASLTKEERSQPILQVLLQKIMFSDTGELPEPVEAICARACEASQNAIHVSARDKLNFYVKKLTLFRDKARLKDKELFLPEKLLPGELEALLDNTLGEFWSNQISHNPVIDAEQIQNIKSVHARAFTGRAGLKSCLLYQYEGSAQNKFAVYYAIDGTIRLVKYENLKQYIIPIDMFRFIDDEYVEVLRVSQFSIKVYANGKLTLQDGGQIVAEVNNLSIERRNNQAEEMTQIMYFYRCQNVRTVAELMAASPQPSTPTDRTEPGQSVDSALEAGSRQPLLPQYQTQQSQAQSSVQTRPVSSESQHSPSLPSASMGQ